MPTNNIIMLDTKVSWFVSICSSLSNIIVFGSFLSYAILFPTIMDEFQEGKAKTAIVASLGLSFHSIGSPLSAKLCIHFGCRMVLIGGGLTCALGLIGSSFAPSLYVLYFSYGIVMGFATSMVYNAGYQIIPLYFEKHCFAASSLASMGLGAGYLVMCPIAQVLLDHFGWRKALLVMAAINVVPTLLGCSITRKIIPSRDEEDTLTRASGCCRCLRSLELSVFKDPTFVILTLSAIASVMGEFMPNMHLAKYAEERKIPSHRSSLLYVIIGGSALVSRLLVGKLCDTGWIPVLRIFQFGCFIMAILNCLLPLMKNFTHLILYSVIFGIGDGASVTPLFSLMNKSYTGMGYGWFMFTLLIPLFVGPTLSGFIADVSGSYHPAFYTAGGISFLSACLPEFTRCIKPKNKFPHKCSERVELVKIFEKEIVL